MKNRTYLRTAALVSAVLTASSSLFSCTRNTPIETENYLILGSSSAGETDNFSAQNTPQDTDSPSADSPDSPDSAETTAETAPLVSHEEDEMYTNRDGDSDYSRGSPRITVNGSGASCGSDSVLISGSTATIKTEGTYIISGQSDDFSVIVDAGKNDKIQLVLDGVSLKSAMSAPINVVTADKVVITLADRTENTLTSGEFDSGSSVDAAIFSKEDLTINGTGSLTVSSPSGHGIISKDDLVVTDGKLTVTSAKQGLGGNDSVRIGGGEITITSGKDGIHAENTDDTTLGFVYISDGKVSITSDGDGVSASAYLEITDGIVNVKSGGGAKNGTSGASGGRDSFGFGAWGGWSYSGSDNYSDSADTTTSTKGLKGQSGIIVTGGEITVDSADDAVHSNGDIKINGGTFTLSSGDDGVHADNRLTVTDGRITVSESYEGLEALHVDVSGGEVTLKASDDGINAAGGMDESGFGNFGGGRGDKGNRMDSGAGKSDYTVTALSAKTASVTRLADNASPEQERPNGGGYGTKERPPKGDRGDMGAPPDMQGGDFSNFGDSSDFGNFGGGFGGMGGGHGFGGSGSGTIVIAGGKIFIDASGDGIDANGTFEMTGGELVISGPTRGDTATLDYDVSGTISGGTFIGMGASGMAQTFSDGTQGVITVSTSLQAGGEIKVEKDGRVIISHKAEQAAAVVILSSPEIAKGETYTLTLGDKSGEVEAK